MSDFRRVAVIACFVIAPALRALDAPAQGYPAKPIRFAQGFRSGDIARQVAQHTRRAPIVARLNSEFVKALHLPEVMSRLANDASIPAGGTPEAFTNYFRDAIAKWVKVLKISGARAY